MQPQTDLKLQLLSHAFAGGEHIPDRYTCQGENVSPPLSWRGVPNEAKSLVLICDDPDAPNGPFTHWVLYDIPPERDFLPEAFYASDQRDWGTDGRNDFGNTKYEGPCPPPGPPHRYYFRLYSLDAKLDLPPGATRAQVIDRIKDHVLNQTELIGAYGRRG